LPFEETDGGIEKIEIMVTSVDIAPRVRSQTVNVQKGLALLENFSISAGEVVEVQSYGAYYVADRSAPVTATGYMGKGLAYPDAPFATAPLGSGMLRIGKGGLMKGYVVAPCANALSPYEGFLAVGINNGVPATARGDLNFDISVRPATAQEWQSGEVAPCLVRERSDSAATTNDSAMARMVGARLNSFGNKLAEAIIKQLHPTGVKATLRSVEMHLTPAAMVAFITSEWHGGLTGNPYTTTVRWEFSTERHIGTFLAKDSAEIQSSPAAKNALDALFKSQIFPVVVK